MSCQKCIRLQNQIRFEQGNHTQYARHLARRDIEPSDYQLATLNRLKREVADTERFFAEHQAECYE